MDSNTILTPLQTVLASIGAGSLAAALIQLYFKLKIDERLKRLESDNTKEIKRIEADYAKEIKRLEAELSREQKVFGRTEEVIAIVYKDLMELKDAGAMVTAHGEETGRKAAEKYTEVFEVFYNHYRTNIIYIPPKLIESIESFYRTVHAARAQYLMALAEARNPYRDMNNAGSIFNAYFATSEQIPSLLIAMHAEFQKVLGVSDEGVKG